MNPAREFVHQVAGRVSPPGGGYERMVRRARRRAFRRRLTAAALGLALTGALVAGLLVTLTSPEQRSARPPAEDPSGWSHVVVQNDGYVGAALSMAVDAGGTANLVYGGSPEEGVDEGEVPLDDGTALPALVHAAVEGDSVTTSQIVDRNVGDGEGSAVAFDARGATHIAWTESGLLYYTNDSAGEFAEPQRVDDFPVHPDGMAMAVTPGGTPWFAFYGEGLEVVTLEAGRWASEKVDEPILANPTLASIALAGDEVYVAYGSGRQTRLAHRRNGRWSVETVDEDGSSGVELAVDPDGEVTIVYVGRDGMARYAEPAEGGGWNITPLRVEASYPLVDVAIDASGAHHFVVYGGGLLYYATDSGGEVRIEPIPRSGDYPFEIAVHGSTVYVAWQWDGDVALATRSTEAGAGAADA